MAMNREYYDEYVREINSFDEYTTADGRVLRLVLVDDIDRSANVCLIYCDDVVVFDFDHGNVASAKDSFFAVCDVLDYLGGGDLG